MSDFDFDHSIPQASAIRIDICPDHRQPVLVFVDQRGRDIAMAHVSLPYVDNLIMAIREGADRARTLPLRVTDA